MPVIQRIHSLQPDDSAIERAADVIRWGGVIIYPTETVYGIGADALNSAAVERVQRVKRRRENKPILVIVRSPEEVTRVAREVGECAKHLMETIWPGPLTLVLKAAETLPVQLTGGTGTIGVRVPSNPICLRLLDACGCPVTSTSANITGHPTVNGLVDVLSAALPGVDLVLDAGELPPSKPSTVIDVTGDAPVLIREGAIPFSRIQTVHTSATR
jgi:L-threonylcarbamoyladenylate synthase